VKRETKEQALAIPIQAVDSEINIHNLPIPPLEPEGGIFVYATN
jgi:hypothetical protein